MRICFISQEYPPETGWGGIGTYVYNISHGLAEAGHHVVVITRAVTTDDVSEFYEGRLRIFRVWPKRYKTLQHPPLKILRLYKHLYHVLDRPLGWGYGAYKCLQQLSAHAPFDVVEVPEHNADGFVYAFRRLLPVRHLKASPALVGKFHIPMLYYYQLNRFQITWDIRIINHFERWTINRADALTSPSRMMAKVVSDMWGFSVANITVLPYPIDDDVFTPGDFSRRDPNMVLFVGRLNPQKGVDDLIVAFKQVLCHCPQAKLVLVGGDYITKTDGVDHSHAAYLQQKCREDGIAASVEFTGAIPRSQLVGYYQRCRLCVVPSKEFESFSNVCAEALACGCPLIAYNIGAIPEMIQDGIQGMLISPGNIKLLKDTIIQLLQDDQLVRTLGQNARQRIESAYAKRIIATKTAEYYTSLVNKND